MTDSVDWAGDDDLLAEGKRAARQAKGCESVVIADADIAGEVTRAYFVCSAGAGRHTVHGAVNGDTWWRDSLGGHWQHEGSELTNLNMKGASVDA